MSEDTLDLYFQPNVCEAVKMRKRKAILDSPPTKSKYNQDSQITAGALDEEAIPAGWASSLMLSAGCSNVKLNNKSKGPSGKMTIIKDFSTKSNNANSKRTSHLKAYNENIFQDFDIGFNNLGNTLGLLDEISGSMAKTLKNPLDSSIIDPRYTFQSSVSIYSKPTNPQLSFKLPQSVENKSIPFLKTKKQTALMSKTRRETACLKKNIFAHSKKKAHVLVTDSAKVPENIQTTKETSAEPKTSSPSPSPSGMLTNKLKQSQKQIFAQSRIRSKKGQFLSSAVVSRMTPKKIENKQKKCSSDKSAKKEVKKHITFNGNKMECDLKAKNFFFKKNIILNGCDGYDFNIPVVSLQDIKGSTKYKYLDVKIPKPQSPPKKRKRIRVIDDDDDVDSNKTFPSDLECPDEGDIQNIQEKTVSSNPDQGTMNLLVEDEQNDKQKGSTKTKSQRPSKKRNRKRKNDIQQPALLNYAAEISLTALKQNDFPDGDNIEAATKSTEQIVETITQENQSIVFPEYVIDKSVPVENVIDQPQKPKPKKKYRRKRYGRKKKVYNKKNPAVVNVNIAQCEDILKGKGISIDNADAISPLKSTEGNKEFNSSELKISSALNSDHKTCNETKTLITAGEQNTSDESDCMILDDNKTQCPELITLDDSSDEGEDKMTTIARENINITHSSDQMNEIVEGKSRKEKTFHEGIKTIEELKIDKGMASHGEVEIPEEKYKPIKNISIISEENSKVNHDEVKIIQDIKIIEKPPEPSRDEILKQFALSVKLVQSSQMKPSEFTKQVIQIKKMFPGENIQELIRNYLVSDINCHNEKSANERATSHNESCMTSNKQDDSFNKQNNTINKHDTVDFKLQNTATSNFQNSVVLNHQSTVTPNVYNVVPPNRHNFIASHDHNVVASNRHNFGAVNVSNERNVSPFKPFFASNVQSTSSPNEHNTVSPNRYNTSIASWKQNTGISNEQKPAVVGDGSTTYSYGRVPLLPTPPTRLSASNDQSFVSSNYQAFSSQLAPSTTGNQVYTSSVSGNQVYTSLVSGNHLTTPSVSGNHLMTPSVSGNQPTTPSVIGTKLTAASPIPVISIRCVVCQKVTASFCTRCGERCCYIQYCTAKHLRKCH